MRVSPLRAAIHDKRFSPAYYLYGEDEYLKEDAVRRLLEAAVDPATRDFNLDVREGAELDAAALSSLLASPPMMAERRVVVVRDSSGLRKDARAALEKYLRAPAADILVVLTAPADAKQDKVLGELTVAVDCEPLTGAQIPKWIVAHAERLEASISPAAVELLQDAVGNDLGQLALELDKLASYTAGHPIDEKAVASVVGVRREETLGHLLNAVANREALSAIALIPGVLQQAHTTSVYVIMALTTQTLALAFAKSRGIPPARQSGEYFNLLRAGTSNVVGRAWGEAVSAWTRAGNQWSLSDLDHALEVLLQADLAIKASRVSSEEQILATAILSMCGGVGKKHAA